MASRKFPKEVYQGYMPIGLPQNKPRNRLRWWFKVVGKPKVTMYPKKEPEEWATEAEYPELNDGTRKGLRSQVRYNWYESLKKLPTAEQKMYEISRHARHFTACMPNWLPTAHSLPFALYLTQTHMIKGLPQSYQRNRLHSEDEMGNKIEKDLTRKLVEDGVLGHIALDRFEILKDQKNLFIPCTILRRKKTYLSEGLVQNIANSVKKALAPEVNPQLLDYQTDLNPVIRSWLYHSGFRPPNNKVFYRSRKDEDGCINQIVQIDGSSAMNMRSEHSLEPIVRMDDQLVTEKSLVEKYNHDPRYYGAKYKFKWPVSLAGFWPEKEPKFDFPHTSFITTDCLNIRNKEVKNYSLPLTDIEDCLNGQAVLTAFSWLNSLAIYHGFTPFQEIDYPFTCQTVTTDGQNWLFNVYQLNTNTFHRDLGGHKRNNVCWSSGLIKLYDVYENGTFKGINDEVFDLLIQFMSQQTNPAYTKQLNLRPYLGIDERSEEVKKKESTILRCFIEQRYNRWMSCDWAVQPFEHIFFRSKEMRGVIRHMKPKFHIPKPVYPKIFE